VKITLTEGRGTIRGLRVGNPSGFSSNDAFSLGEITLDLDTGSITESPVVVETLTIAAPEVHFEMTANAKSNVDAILANVKKYQGGGGGQPAAEESGGEALKLKVQKFTFQDGKVDVDVTALAGAGKATSVALPALTMKNLGGKSGAPPGDIGAEVTRPADGPEALAPLHAWLFGEDQARYIVTVSDAEALVESARVAGVPMPFSCSAAARSSSSICLPAFSISDSRRASVMRGGGFVSSARISAASLRTSTPGASALPGARGCKPASPSGSTSTAGAPSR
jgi:hypothetical protein